MNIKKLDFIHVFSIFAAMDYRMFNRIISSLVCITILIGLNSKKETIVKTRPGVYFFAKRIISSANHHQHQHPYKPQPTPHHKKRIHTKGLWRDLSACLPDDLLFARLYIHYNKPSCRTFSTHIASAESGCSLLRGPPSYLRSI